MKRPRTAKAASRFRLAESVLTAVMQVLTAHGLSRSERELLARNVLVVDGFTTARNPKRNTRSEVLGTALAVWHRDVRFLQKDGTPKPLRRSGRTASLEALARAATSEVNPALLAADLVTAGLAHRKRGAATYLPTGRSARMEVLNEQQIEHVAQGIGKLLQTILANYSTPMSLRLFEQSASVRSLPQKHRQAFRNYLNSQGSSFVANVDDWLESRVSKTRGKLQRPSSKRLSRCMHAGVYAFGFMS